MMETDSIEVGNLLSGTTGKAGVYISMSFNGVEITAHGCSPKTAREMAVRLCALADEADAHDSGEKLIDFESPEEPEEVGAEEPEPATAPEPSTNEGGAP